MKALTILLLASACVNGFSQVVTTTFYDKWGSPMASYDNLGGVNVRGVKTNGSGLQQPAAAQATRQEQLRAAEAATRAKLAADAAFQARMAQQDAANRDQILAAQKAARDKGLKWNQEQAAKGDAYGLFRMGERYRDGDGVPKDLTKAREFLTKATEAGSPSSSDALARLNLMSTNSPAQQ